MRPICPLCESYRIFLTRRVNISLLRKEWLLTFGFDPFLDFGEIGESLEQLRCSTCDLEFFSGHYYGDSAFYERLSRGREWYYEECKWEFQEAIQRLQANSAVKTILEVGCGMGYFLEKVRSCYDVLGVEFNSEALRVCESKGLKVVNTRLEDIDSEFDAVVAFQVLEHIPSPRQFLDQVIRVVSPQGTLILSVPNPQGYLSEFNQALLTDMPPHHATRWSRKAFESVGKQYGLELVDVCYEPLRYIHYLQYIRMLSGQYWQPSPRPLRQRIWRIIRSFGSPALEAVGAALAYQYHKTILKGHSHLVEYKKQSLG